MNENGVIRVVIVDDNEMQRKILLDALKTVQDIECCGQAQDGVEALKVLRREEPDVLLMDIVMPYMDGIDLLSKLRTLSLPKRPYILAMTAYRQEHIGNAVLEQGADDFVLKPYILENLFDRIRALANRQQSDRRSLPNHPDSAVADAVMKLGIPTNSFGYSYLEQALTILLSHEGTCLIGKDVYGTIAGPNRTTAQCVEKSLRKAIREAFAADSEELHRILKLGGMEDVKHLSNGRFLTLMARSLRQGKS